MTIQPAVPSNGHVDHGEAPPSVITTPPASAAHPASTPPSVPKRDIALSAVTDRPIPRRQIPRVLALVEEQQRIGRQRDPETQSQMEALVMSMGLLAAEEVRDRGAEQLGEVVDQAATIQTELTALRAELGRVDDAPVTGMDGEVVTAADATKRMDMVSATVVEERNKGSVKHRRVPGWLRRLVPLAVLLDFPVLLYFVTQVFNVDLAGIARGDGAAWGQSIVPLITSVVFALLGTGAVAIGLHFFGRDLKGYKDFHGHIQLPEGKARVVPLVFLVLALLIALGAGVVMAFRVISDSLNSGGGVTGAAILGFFFALIVVVLNVVVFSVHYRDGSLLTDEIDHLAGQLGGIELRRVALQRQCDGLVPQLAQLRLKAERLYATTLSKMGAPLKGADQLKLLARSYHQGCGPEASFISSQGNPSTNLLAPQVAVDRSMLDQLMDQLDQLVTPDTADTKDTPIPFGLSGPPMSRSSRNATRLPLAAADAGSRDDDADDLGGEW